MTYRSIIEKCVNNNIEKEAIQLLITERLNINKSELLLSLDKEICCNIEEDIEQLLSGIPVQYILGYTYFYKYKFFVDKNVLIPRFDTEVLIEETIKIINETNKNKLKVLDIGTGSGCIAITLKKELVDIEVSAIDISKEALDIAKKNAILNNVDINFIHNDLLKNINDKFDIIISNPPYIDIEENVMELVKDYEPHLALYSPNKGLYHYEEILKQSNNNLKENGIIIFEIPANRDEEIISLVLKYYNNYKIIKDYNNLSRVIIIRS